MEPGFVKANSSLPRIDLLMLGEFLATNKEFCSSEFRNVKTFLSSRPSYGDDAISYVQLKREEIFAQSNARFAQSIKSMQNYMLLH
ncbi:hypothetical protein EVAR_87747_1 [Eumeta japonica]|uniref:Uncharacterized protein n=1 Tax=Eumeta variegata TaxID=151549 RepID=A0A4C1ZQX4_EUMVA|nr:hypothetical protein EVAR_87747_1 [Eumeta japonica]